MAIVRTHTIELDSKGKAEIEVTAALVVSDNDVFVDEIDSITLKVRKGHDIAGLQWHEIDIALDSPFAGAINCWLTREFENIYAGDALEISEEEAMGRAEYMRDEAIDAEIDEARFGGDR